MKIKQALAHRPLDRKLKVGAEKGSRFFYCGTIGDFIDKIDNYSVLCKTNALNFVADAEKRFNSRIANEPTIGKFVREEAKSMNPNFSLENYVKYIEWHFRVINKMAKTLDNAKLRLDKFVELADRNVVDVREADPTVDPGVTIVIIDGYEYGAYWTMDEAIGNTSIKFFNSNDDD